MSRTLTVGRLLPLAFALIVAGWALAPSLAMAGVAPAPAPQPALAAAKAAPGCGGAVAGPLAAVLNPAPTSSVPPFMDPTGDKKGYCHCGCGPATCHTSADCGGASCDPFPSCC
jgi:hypothetical protein